MPFLFVLIGLGAVAYLTVNMVETKHTRKVFGAYTLDTVEKDNLIDWIIRKDGVTVVQGVASSKDQADAQIEDAFGKLGISV
jgi:hypothetical protein